MTKKSRTPQEKKRLSYDHDRRNNYGNSAKAARSAIPLRKRKEARAARHLANQHLSVEVMTKHLDAVDGQSPRARAKHLKWSKGPDEPLRSFVARKLARRGQSSNRNGKGRKV